MHQEQSASGPKQGLDSVQHSTALLPRPPGQTLGQPAHLGHIAPSTDRGGGTTRGSHAGLLSTAIDSSGDGNTSTFSWNRRGMPPQRGRGRDPPGDVDPLTVTACPLVSLFRSETTLDDAVKNSVVIEAQRTPPPGSRIGRKGKKGESLLQRTLVTARMHQAPRCWSHAFHENPWVPLNNGGRSYVQHHESLSSLPTPMRDGELSTDQSGVLR